MAQVLGEARRWPEAFVVALAVARRDGLDARLIRIIIHAGLHAPILRSREVIVDTLLPLFEKYLGACTSTTSSTPDVVDLPHEQHILNIRALFEMTVYCVELSFVSKEFILSLLETVIIMLKTIEPSHMQLSPSEATLLLGQTLDFSLWVHGWLTCVPFLVADSTLKSRRIELLHLTRRLADQLTIHLDGCIPLSMELTGMLLWEPDGNEGQFDGLRGIYTHLRELTLLATPAPSQTDTYISPEALSIPNAANKHALYGFDQGVVALALLAGAVHALSLDGEMKLEPQDVKELQKYALAALSILSAAGGRKTRHIQLLECLFYFNVYKYYHTAREEVVDAQEDVTRFLTSQDNLLAVCHQKIMSLPFLGIRDGRPESDLTSEDESNDEVLMEREDDEDDDDFAPFDTPLTWFSTQLAKGHFLASVRMALYLVSSELRICTHYDYLSTLITSLSSLFMHYAATSSSAPYVLESPHFQVHWEDLLDACCFAIALYPLLYMTPYALSDDLLDQIAHGLQALREYARPQLLEYEARACLSRGRDLLSSLKYSPTPWEQRQVVAITASSSSLTDLGPGELEKRTASYRARSYTHYYLLRQLHDQGIVLDATPLPSEPEQAALTQAYAALGAELCIAARRAQ